jgi:hypothetical protein
VLRWSAVALASPIVLHGELLSRVATASSRTDDMSPANLELVTLTEDRAVVTWYTGYTGTDDGLGRMRPAPARGEVHWGTNPRRLNRVAAGASGETPYHYAELTGLEPGQTYYYQARSNGKPVPPTQFTLINGNAVGTSDFGLGTGGPYTFTAPEPPPGRFLFSVALCNDLHMGETQARTRRRPAADHRRRTGSRPAALSGGPSSTTRASSAPTSSRPGTSRRKPSPSS